MDQKKALFLPFMQIPTGHHHVADALINEIKTTHKDIVCDKVDILSYSYGGVEKVVSSTYLAWIRKFPDVYDWLYKQAAYKKTSPHNRQYLYETMFTYFLKRLTNQQNPSVLFCTHALPSNIAAVLKKKNKLQSITVNVYTDFFINRIWGIDGIDYHMVPTVSVKEYLLEKGVAEKRIFITGIPIHQVFHSGQEQQTKDEGISVLVTGGSLGVGAIRKLLNYSHSDRIHYYVLCGKNEVLYEQLLRKDKPTVTPLPYITSKEEMNLLYNKVDAVLTKPGGVTVSECLMKRKPIFVYDPLPGQEKINVNQLNQIGVVFTVDLENNLLEEQILDFFCDERKQCIYRQKVDAYHRNLDERPLSLLIEEIIQKKH
ncbi:UDP-N-acetylglucosamine:LPS N-acetylglucosamine transferase [Virgibacillus subterraneus]|uniref:UDP-N-acetylglucosamine:LPS N-acetylglucosamine transferase n=1 Tax=Virgibacillus subterraneus TaxID=621109 RepID=A0A1H9BRB7_9BACI|nr:UDP-glucuronosyltransferase [Virgibacillus subterraneus]SEP91500.1 UDP-N-acetylglucosamine:LPS N-acetylglucosamine transferase [Virgibacillus subterraneus]